MAGLVPPALREADFMRIWVQRFEGPPLPKVWRAKKRPKTRVRFRTTLDFDRGYPRKKMVNANLVHYPQSSRGYVYPPKINSVRIFQQLYRLQSLISPNGSRCRQAESDVNYDPFHV